MAALGLAPGDAEIIRNAGARVTAESLITLILGVYLLGVEWAARRVATYPTLLEDLEHGDYLATPASDPLTPIRSPLRRRCPRGVRVAQWPQTLAGGAPVSAEVKTLAWSPLAGRARPASSICRSPFPPASRNAERALITLGE